MSKKKIPFLIQQYVIYNTYCKRMQTENVLFNQTIVK